MRILGIDPGVATIGFGVIDAQRQNNTLIRYGVISTPAGLPLRVQACEGQQGGDQPVQPFHAQDLVPDEFPDHFQQHLPFSSRTQERRIASMESRKLIHSPQFRE